MLAGAVLLLSFSQMKPVWQVKGNRKTYQERKNGEPRRDFEPVLEEFLGPLAIVLEVNSFGRKGPGGFIALNIIISLACC